MKFLNLFKIYNLKLMKKEKRFLFITIISILTTITISLVIPQFNKGNEGYIDDNIRDFNGGDLSVVLMDNGDEELHRQLDTFRERGLRVDTSFMTRTYFLQDTNKVISGIVEGDYGLKEDEIILNQGVANTLGVTIGDYVKRDTMGDGVEKYKVKAIEPMAMAVDRDTELSSYGKIQYDKNKNYKDYYSMVFVSGENGDKLKKEFIENVDGYRPITLEDKRGELKDNIQFQTAILSTLSTIGYILSSLAIITTTIMIILNRKKDIAIMRMLSINACEIKKSMRLELALWLVCPIIIGGIISFPIGNLLLKYMGIPVNQLDSEILYLIIKGIIFNGLIFIILSNITMYLINSMKAITLIREDQEEIKKSIKRIIIKSVFILPVILIIYSIYIGSMGALLSSFIMMVSVVFFIVLILLVIKLITLFKYRNSVIMYGFKSIKANSFSFIITLISITMTLWFVMIGFTMEKNISGNLKETFNNALPYNYLVSSQDLDLSEIILNDDKSVEGYNKVYSKEGKVLNDLPNPFLKVVVINKVSKENYNAKFNITRGNNLYEGNDTGAIVTDDFLEKNRLQVGDELQIQVNKKIVQVKIKGSYNSAGINSVAIYLESDLEDGEARFEVKANNDEFISRLTNSEIMKLDEIADVLTIQIRKIVGVFKLLSFLSIISIILLNINIVNMSNNLERKDKEIIKAIGLGKKFIMKVEGIKITLIVIISTILSLGLYTLIMNLFFGLMFNSTIEIDFITFIVVVFVGAVVTIISYLGVLIRNRFNNLDLIRE